MTPRIFINREIADLMIAYFSERYGFIFEDIEDKKAGELLFALNGVNFYLEDLKI